jgi:hypothetical protein
VPGKDGTGPLGSGPLTGRGDGFCVVRLKGSGPSGVKGFAGLQGRPLYETTDNRKEAAMPAGDGTGSMRMGPMTGRGAGRCAGHGAPGYMNPIPGRGFGMGFRLRQGFGGQVGRGRGGGRGGRRGWCNGLFHALGLPERTRRDVSGDMPVLSRELSALKQQAEYLGNALESIRKRIQEVESSCAAD